MSGEHKGEKEILLSEGKIKRYKQRADAQIKHE